jgi:RHS repeat-associated protein
MANTLGQHNPLRYRGYVYDRETGLYYLQSRYYNPEWGRFINADVLGGVEGRSHMRENINKGYWYLGISSLLGPVGYIFLFGEY